VTSEPLRGAHHRELGVGLQFDEAEHNLRAGAFEIARPADIGFFVKARLEFDERVTICRPAASISARTIGLSERSDKASA